jgi:hypothetical protein
MCQTVVVALLSFKIKTIFNIAPCVMELSPLRMKWTDSDTRNTPLRLRIENENNTIVLWLTVFEVFRFPVTSRFARVNLPRETIRRFNMNFRSDHRSSLWFIVHVKISRNVNV